MTRGNQAQATWSRGPVLIPRSGWTAHAQEPSTLHD